MAEAQRTYLTRPTRFQVRTEPRAAADKTSQYRYTTDKNTEVSETIIVDENHQTQVATAVRTEAVASTAMILATQSSPDPFESDEDFQVVQPKRKRGRPSPYEVRPEHAVGSQDIRQAFNPEPMDE